MSYIDGFVTPARSGVSAEEYRAFAAKGAEVLKECGAIRIVEAWGDDVPHGKTTDFYRSVGCEEGETPVFSWIEWPDKATRDAGMKKMMEDPRMQMTGEDMPFAGERLIYGGFRTLLDE